MLTRTLSLAALAAVLSLAAPVYADDTPSAPAASTTAPLPATAAPIDPQAPAVNPAPLPAAPEVAAPPVAYTQDGEIRAMWVVRDSMTSRDQIRNAVALAKKYGFNTLFVQVRGRGDAYYTSHFEPRSEQLAHTPADFDPLAFAIEEGHKSGLEVHAWLDTFLVWHLSRNPYSSLHIINRHPGWVVRDQNGHVQHTETNDCEGAFLDPGLPAVRAYLKNVFADVAQHYNVDGIHLDYVRYPADRFSFSPTDMHLFRAWLAPRLSEDEISYADRKVAHGSPLAWYYLHPDAWADWRRANVTATVRGISEAVHAAKPNVIVSAAVFPNYRVAYEDKGQAWRDWLKSGLLDAACPMSYNRSTQVAAAQIRDAIAHSGGKPIIAGVGAWQVPSTSAIAKGRAYRSLGAAGINFFSYNGMTRDGSTERYLQSLRTGLFSSRSVPRNWRRAVKPVAPPAPAATGTETQAAPTTKPADVQK